MSNTGNIEIRQGTSTTSKKWDTGKKYIDSAGAAHVIYAKALTVGALPNATTKNVPHGEAINILGKYVNVVALWATNDTTVKTLNSSGITVDINATNVVVGTGADLSTYDEGVVVIEFCL